MKADQLTPNNRPLPNGAAPVTNEARIVNGQYMEQNIGYIKRNLTSGPVLLPVYKIFKLVTVQTRKVYWVNGIKLRSDWHNVFTFFEFVETQIRLC